VAVLESALERHPEIYHLIVCCNEGGRMARIGANAANVCRLILNDEVNDRGLAMTSSFSNMVVAGHCLANLQDLDSYALRLRSLIGIARKLLPQAAQLASQYVAEKFSKICFLGTGTLHAVAVESALKVLELTAGRIVTLSESFLGVRHGPLSAIDSDTLVVAFVSSEAKRRSYELDLLEEVTAKKLAKNIVLVASSVDIEAEKRFAKIGTILALDGPVADCYRAPADVVVGQLFGLFASIGLGLKPDSPSPQGAISRVVSKVRIY
jgi:tagatose-6-phosphate ketose/aldose isomerase